MRGLDATKPAVKVVGGPRGCMAKAIILMESTKPEHRVQVRKLLQLINPYTGRAFRAGISGMLETDKSTFVNAMGIKLIEECDHQVAMLAVDSSSIHTDGSILGDHARMGDLAMREETFIRPSPSAGRLGGVTHATRESTLMLEVASYNITLVETVGVGQSEVAVAGTVDTPSFLYVARIGGQLRGIKHDILGLADVTSITKADGGSEDEA